MTPLKTDLSGLARAATDLLNTAFQRGVRHGRYLERLEAAPKWISVKDKPIPHLEHVWMYSMKCKNLYVGMRGHQNPNRIYIEPGPDLNVTDISHWMPLPEPPKEV